MTHALVLQAPGPRGLPVLGDLLAFRSDRLGLLRDAARHGPRSSFRLGARRIYLFNDPADIQAILVDHADQVEQIPAMVDMLRPMLGNGLITAPRELHRLQRRRLAPIFQPRRVATYAEIMLRETGSFLGKWRDGQIVDLYREMTRLTLAIIGATLFGRQVDDIAPIVAGSLTTVLQHLNKKWGSLVLTPDSWPLPANRRYHAALASLDQVIKRVIAERQSEPTGTHNDLLSMLLDARLGDTGAPMSLEQVRDEAMTLFLAGHETTANALSWGWHLLMQHPPILAQLREEVTQVVGDAPLGYDHLAQMPYTLGVLKEIVRLYPSVYIISRYAMADFALPDGTAIPQRTILIISPYTLHRRPDFWPEPDRFDPTRFLGTAEQQRPRNWYLPFGLGPHACIGSHFAMLEAQIILVEIARRFDLRPLYDGEPHPEPLIALRPRGPLPIQVNW